MAVPDAEYMTAPALAPDLRLDPLPCDHGFLTELVRRCGRGDPAALARLFDLFYAPVAAEVANRVPSDAVEPVVAEVFAQLWRQAPEFVPGRERAVGWVMGLVDGAVTTAALQVELAARRADIADLRASLATRPVIDQAKGILMARHRCTADEAFQMLSQASQRENRKLRDLARSVVASVAGGDQLPARTSSATGSVPSTTPSWLGPSNVEPVRTSRQAPSGSGTVVDSSAVIADDSRAATTTTSPDRANATTWSDSQASGW